MKCHFFCPDHTQLLFPSEYHRQGNESHNKKQWRQAIPQGNSSPYINRTMSVLLPLVHKCRIISHFYTFLKSINTIPSSICLNLFAISNNHLIHKADLLCLLCFFYTVQPFCSTDISPPNGCTIHPPLYQ